MRKILAVMAAVAMVQSAMADEDNRVAGEKLDSGLGTMVYGESLDDGLGTMVYGESLDSGLGELTAMDLQVYMVPAPIQTANLDR